MDMVRRKWRTGHHANCKWTCVRQKNPTWGTCVFTNKLRVADKQLFVGSKSIVLETCYGYCSCFDQTVAVQFLVLRRLRQQFIMGSVEWCYKQQFNRLNSATFQLSISSSANRIAIPRDHCNNNLCAVLSLACRKCHTPETFGGNGCAFLIFRTNFNTVSYGHVFADFGDPECAQSTALSGNAIQFQRWFLHVLGLKLQYLGMSSRRYWAGFCMYVEICLFWFGFILAIYCKCMNEIVSNYLSKVNNA